MLFKLWLVNPKNHRIFCEIKSLERRRRISARLSSSFSVSHLIFSIISYLLLLVSVNWGIYQAISSQYGIRAVVIAQFSVAIRFGKGLKTSSSVKLAQASRRRALLCSSKVGIYFIEFRSTYNRMVIYPYYSKTMPQMVIVCLLLLPPWTMLESVPVTYEANSVRDSYRCNPCMSVDLLYKEEVVGLDTPRNPKRLYLFNHSLK
jgi:hypothetical protein